MTKYNADAIEVLTGLEPVRKRPGMYTDTSRPNHLIQEVVDNSVDEALAETMDFCQIFVPYNQIYLANAATQDQVREPSGRAGSQLGELRRAYCRLHCQRFSLSWARGMRQSRGPRGVRWSVAATRHNSSKKSRPSDLGEARDLARALELARPRPAVRCVR
mgnify:CR=1 FL=1